MLLSVFIFDLQEEATQPLFNPYNAHIREARPRRLIPKKSMDLRSSCYIKGLIDTRSAYPMQRRQYNSIPNIKPGNTKYLQKEKVQPHGAVKTPAPTKNRGTPNMEVLNRATRRLRVNGGICQIHKA
jgi:hypothetical protein